MSEDAFAVRSEDIVHRHAIPAAMIRDLLAVASLDETSVLKLRQSLSELRGIEGREQLESRLAECVRDSLSAGPEITESIVRVLMNLEPQGVSRLCDMLKQWRAQPPERLQIFGDDTLSRLRAYLDHLIVDMPSVQLMRKANLLLRQVGNEFESIDFFCDLRPVFDDDRKQVEGFVNLTNMRLMYVTQNGDRKACEIALTEDELRQIVRRGEQAISKLDVLKSVSCTTNKSEPTEG